MKTFLHFITAAFIVCLVAQCKSTKPVNQVPPATLLNTYWRLAEMNGEPVRTPESAREVHIILSSDDGQNQLKGFAGCNTLGGTFNVDGNKLSFSAFSTKMMCSPDRMKVEDFLFNVLATTDTYVLEGATLHLLQGDVEIAEFQSVHLK